MKTWFSSSAGAATQCRTCECSWQASLLNEDTPRISAAWLTGSALPAGSWQREMPDGCARCQASLPRRRSRAALTVASVQRQLPLPPPLRSRSSRAQTSWRSGCRPWRSKDTGDRVRASAQLAAGTEAQAQQPRCLARRQGGNAHSAACEVNWSLFPGTGTGHGANYSKTAYQGVKYAEECVSESQCLLKTWHFYIEYEELH